MASCSATSSTSENAEVAQSTTSIPPATSTTSTTIPLNPERLLNVIRPQDLDIRTMERFSLPGFSNWVRSSEWSDSAVDGIAVFCGTQTIFDRSVPAPKAKFSWRENVQRFPTLIELEIFEFSSPVQADDYFERWSNVLKGCVNKEWSFGNAGYAQTRTIDNWVYTLPNRPPNLLEGQGIGNISESAIVSESILSITDIREFPKNSNLSSTFLLTLDDLYVRAGKYVYRVGTFASKESLSSNRLLGVLNIAAAWPIEGLHRSQLSIN